MSAKPKSQAVVAKCLGSADGRPFMGDGLYLVSFDLEAHDGLGSVEFTSEPRLAKRFADLAEFHRAYTSVPLCRPLRADGRPNRPLTATHWEMVKVES